MIKAIRKDLILHKKFFVLTGVLYPLYLGFLGSRVNNTLLLPVFGGLLYALVPFILFGREDKFKSLAFGLSLPVTRREFLGARFLLSWGLMLSMYLAGSVIMVLAPGGKLTAATVFSPRMILLSLAFLSLIFGVVMPLFTRFGQVGLLVMLVVFQVLGILLLIFRSAVVIETIKKLFRLVPNGIAWIQSTLGNVPAFLSVLALLVLFSFGSFALSLVLFRRKEF
jgi:hypothetical protein